MPTLQELSDVAIVTHRIFAPRGIDFGFFGGFAINLLGGNRTSKDLDCAVDMDKEEIVELFEQFPHFQYLGNTRGDVAKFMLGEVLLEMFPTPMEQLRGNTGQTIVRGTNASGTTTILDPCAVFKGKLAAAAGRAKFTDAADLLLLAGRFEEPLKERCRELNQTLAGLAMKRYPHLELAFARLGIDIERCKRLVEDSDLQQLPAIPRAVQAGLLFGLQ
ncbi:Hypothetical predicted protein [Lecanosticta acicola]|uniref:Uncharacterized protein n=1 Tax=Lecanosticta acicola TaxID=111012 RepID=A0AAI8Z2S2_9PEZI|nr:Hypothetical predicted protein [Lecanosticta acicola]